MGRLFVLLPYGNSGAAFSEMAGLVGGGGSRSALNGLKAASGELKGSYGLKRELLRPSESRMCIKHLF